MNPEFTNILDQRIAFYQSRGTGQPVFFVHGNSLSALTWQEQFDSELGDKYRLIAPDLPGHGRSEPARDPSKIYSLPGFFSFIEELSGQLNAENAVFVGHSLGGHILIEAYDRLQKAAGFVLFGTPPIQAPDHPMERSHYPNPAYAYAFKGELSEEERNTLLGMYVKEGAVVPGVIRESFMACDPDMREYLGVNTALDKVADEAGIVARMTHPLAIFHPEGDRFIRGTYFDELEIPTLWRGNTQFIPDSGHCPQLEQPAAFNKLLEAFMADILNK
jgi:pimeloyl-ACP methyl ester carboxylesterase